MSHVSKSRFHQNLSNTFYRIKIGLVEKKKKIGSLETNTGSQKRLNATKKNETLNVNSKKTGSRILGVTWSPPGDYSLTHSSVYV